MAAVRGSWVLAVCLTTLPLAHADSADKPSKPPPPPDPIADIESREANLESRAPREGVVVAAAIGFGFLIGGDIGVGSGGAYSFRIGHVATRRTVITLEITGTGALHRQAMENDPVTDTNAGLFAGAQTYASRSAWFRIAGGPTTFTANLGTDQQRIAAGVGGLIGGGFDLARWGYLVLGLETFGMGAVTRDGVKLQLGFALGLSYY